MTENQNTVISLVLMQIKPSTVVTEDIILTYVNVFSQLNVLTEHEKAEVISDLHAKLSIRMDRGSFVKEKDHVTWYYSAKKDLPSDFWDRYRTYLFKEAGFNSDVINTLDASTDEMMDLLGNPASSTQFQRRGLIMGDVQSGKTGTYTALINKAADAGYRIIILLTGTIEKLRRQTQGRLDAGFVGLDSTAFNKNKDNVLVGVGNINPSISSWTMTSTSSDFNTATASKLNGQLSNIGQPVLFVLKKNKSVLEKLEQWLRIYNANPSDKKIYMPMLMIDDEADNASVNTKKEDENPTAINSAIRKLLKLFVKSNYVGFTATPFANIFIDPDSDEEMIAEDLFPKHFIYALEAPSNYVGALGIFSENGKYSYMLKSNDDCEHYLPEKHMKDFVPSDLPLSLREAVASFFIANVVRDLRGHTKKHRSMLINVSRFINVQEHIQKAVDGYVRDFQREIKNYYLIGEEALQYKTFSFLKQVFDNYFAKIPGFEFSWDTIQKALHEAVASIVVRSVNGGNAPKNLNYDECEEDGLRIIAVGGYSLSRGLTLEGLCVSYFYRNSKMYDTLMQMGRWFGYRNGYADICQIWMSEGAIDWYSYISTATEELRREVRRMQAANKTPIEFGLCVRSDINTLLVTARNKMRTAKDYTMTVSLNGKVVETPYLYMDKEVTANNLKLTETFLMQLKNDGYSLADNKDLAIKHPQILGVPKAYVIDFLSEFKSHYLNVDFRTSDLVGLINNYADDTVDYWDIVIANGDATPKSFCGIDIRYVERRFAIKSESKAIQVSGKGSRLGSANFAKGGLSKEDAHKIEADEKELQKITGQVHAFSQELYFTSGIKRNPLLVIYPVELKPISKNANNADETDLKKKEIVEQLSKPVIGLGVGIPLISGKRNITYQYKINLVMYQELFGEGNDFDEEDVIFNEGTEY